MNTKITPYRRIRPQIKDYSIIDTNAKLHRLARKMMKVSEFAFDTETNTLRVNGENKDFLCVCITISWGAYDNYYIPLNHRREEDVHRNLLEGDVVETLQPVFDRDDVIVIGQNLRLA